MVKIRFNPPQPAGSRSRRLHALRWFTGEAFRRRISRQLNRGKALNDLGKFILSAQRGAIVNTLRQNFVVNACIYSTTCYLQDTIDARRAEGNHVSDDAIAHLSPDRFEAINTYGTLSFDVAGVLKRRCHLLRGG